MSAAKRAKAAAPTPRNLKAPQKPSPSADHLGERMTEGVALNGLVLAQYLKVDHGVLPLADLMASLKSQGEAVNAGDLGAAERMLSAQAVSLNAIFGDLACRAALNMSKNLGAAETYLRLALKAQSQSRATVETLAAMKNPLTVYARQVNVANGPQQVNNGSVALMAGSSSHPQETVIEPNKLLEAPNGERMDFGTKGKASRAHPHLEPVEALNRPEEP